MPGEEREIIIITYFLLQFSLFVITVKTAQNMTKKPDSTATVSKEGFFIET